MLDLIVFTQYPNAYGPKRFADEAISKNKSSTVIGYNDVDIVNLPGAKSVILREPNAKDNIYDLRDKILRYYLSLGTKVLNSNSYLEWSVFDKITQTKEFEKAGIPHLKNLNIKNVKFPFVVKNKLGSHGSHVFKIERSEDLDNVLETHRLKDLLIQEFQTCGFDLRIIVISNKVLGIMKRTPKNGEFLSNYSQGGSVERYKDRHKDIENIAIKTAGYFKLDYCGVDLIKDNKGDWIVLEVNRACQFKGFEESTGVDVAESVLEFLEI